MATAEKQLLKAAQAGNSEAFGALYALYANELYAYACAVLQDRHTAEDAVQETCLKVYMNLKSIRKPEAVKAYFFKTLSNTAKTLLRRNSLAPVGELREEMSAPDCTEDVAETRTDLGRALKTLSEEERQIVLLSAVAGFTSKEIADVTDLTAGSVRSKLSRSLKKLRTDLTEQE